MEAGIPMEGMDVSSPNDQRTREPIPIKPVPVYGPGTVRGEISAILHPEKPVPEKTPEQVAYEQTLVPVFLARKDTPPTFGDVQKFVDAGLNEIDAAIKRSPVGGLENRGNVTLDAIQWRFEMAKQNLDGTNPNLRSLEWVMQRGQEDTVEQQMAKLHETVLAHSPKGMAQAKENLNTSTKQSSDLAMQAVKAEFAKGKS